VIVSCAVKEPAVTGENVTFTCLELPGENENGPVPFAENGVPAGPLMLPSSMPLPWFTTFTFALA